jgi:hypothetical protein
MPRYARWAVIAIGAALVVLAIVAGAGSRTATLRRLVIDTLADRLDSEIELQSFSVDTFPTVDIRGEGLVVRWRGARDVPPLVSIRSFRITGGMAGLVTRPRRFRMITLHGLEINIPPGGPHFKDHSGQAADADSPDQPSSSPIRIDVLESNDALLRLIPSRAGKIPREFAIHRLRMTGVGVERRMPFSAELTNPMPRGFIRTEGRFGPWARREPGATPLDGTYTFENADLSTIQGIGGTLTSIGEFSGLLARIDVKGETRTSDFHLDLTGKPLPLTTRFQAVVDGTDGDTYLKAVDATLGRSSIFASGSVTGTPGVKGRTVQLHVKVSDGRIEDFLQLAVKSSRPPLTGRIALHTDFVLPPGKRDVVDKLRLTGQFDLSSAQFTDPGVREKLAAMSQKAGGTEPGDPPDSVLTDLEGRFKLSDAMLALSELRFQVPGAEVRLSGTYGLKSEALDFDGTLRMRATISEAAGGGLRSVFLKVFDPLFKKQGAGAVIPIRVHGTREQPKFGLDVVKALTPK